MLAFDLQIKFKNLFHFEYVCNSMTHYHYTLSTKKKKKLKNQNTTYY